MLVSRCKMQHRPHDLIREIRVCMRGATRVVRLTFERLGDRCAPARLCGFQGGQQGLAQVIDRRAAICLRAHQRKDAIDIDDFVCRADQRFLGNSGLFMIFQIRAVWAVIRQVALKPRETLLSRINHNRPVVLHRCNRQRALVGPIRAEAEYAAYTLKSACLCQCGSG